MLKYCISHLVVFCSPPEGSGWIIGVGWLGSSSTASGSSDPVRTVSPNSSLGVGTYFLLHITLFLLFSLLSSYILLLHVSSSYFILAVPVHARVFGKALVHEFHISYSQAEWCLPFSGCATAS